MKVLLRLYVMFSNLQSGTSLKVQRGSDGWEVVGYIRHPRQHVYLSESGVFRPFLLIRALHGVKGLLRIQKKQETMFYSGRAIVHPEGRRYGRKSQGQDHHR